MRRKKQVPRYPLVSLFLLTLIQAKSFSLFYSWDAFFLHLGPCLSFLSFKEIGYQKLLPLILPAGPPSQAIYLSNTSLLPYQALSQPSFSLPALHIQAFYIQASQTHSIGSRASIQWWDCTHRHRGGPPQHGGGKGQRQPTILGKRRSERSRIQGSLQSWESIRAGFKVMGTFTKAEVWVEQSRKRGGKWPSGFWSGLRVKKVEEQGSRGGGEPEGHGR